MLVKFLQLRIICVTPVPSLVSNPDDLLSQRDLRALFVYFCFTVSSGITSIVSDKFLTSVKTPL